MTWSHLASSRRTLLGNPVSVRKMLPGSLLAAYVAAAFLMFFQFTKQDPTLRSHVYIAPIGGGEERHVSDDRFLYSENNAVWTADGRYIVFTSSEVRATASPLRARLRPRRRCGRRRCGIRSVTS